MTAMDPQWALLAAALVFIITPGIALFYGGRERATSMVNMMMLSAGAIAVTTIVWTLWGWSMAFAGKDMIGGVVGDPVSGLLLRDSMVADHKRNHRWLQFNLYSNQLKLKVTKAKSLNLNCN